MGGLLPSWDVALFRWVNGGWASPPLDAFFSFFTQYRNFLPIIVPFLLYLLVFGRRPGRILFLGLALAIPLADQSASHLVKPWVERVRPCNALEDVRTPMGRSHAPSFPSSHAANMGAAMFLLAMAYRRGAPFFILLALLAGLSRIYLGLHYPSDVLGGYVLGIWIGWAVWRGMGYLDQNFEFKILNYEFFETRRPKAAGRKAGRGHGRKERR